MSELKMPYFSIIVPAYNEEKYIADCLSSLLQIDYPKSCYEVIVVDNGSSDRTVEIAQTFDVQVHVKTGVKVGGVRNYGASLAEGEIFAFIDGDCVVNKNLLTECASNLSSESIGAVGGMCLLRNNPNWVETAWVISEEPIKERTNILAGGSFIVKANIFQSLGGFDESINAGEDTKLAKQIADKYEVWKLPACAVIHLGYPRTIVDFSKRQFWHASSYRKSNLGLFKDKIYLLVVLFVLSFFSLILHLFTQNMFTLYSSLFLVVSPFVFSINRLRKVSLTFKVFKKVPLVFTLDFMYFFAKGCGLIVSYLHDPFKKNN